jgi:hypothetical protein
VKKKKKDIKEKKANTLALNPEKTVKKKKFSNFIQVFIDQK